MRIIKITVNNNEYEFVCDSRDTRYGFAHDCNLIINGTEYAVSHCYYLNRTWEAWTYQSVCINALSLVMNEYIEQEKSAYKDIHGYKKMTATRTADFENELKERTRYKEYNECMDNLRYHLH